MLTVVGEFNSLRGNKEPLQKVSSTSEGKRKAERGLMGLLLGRQSSTGFTNAVAFATAPAVNVVPMDIAVISIHLSRAMGVISDWTARFEWVEKIIRCA